MKFNVHLYAVVRVMVPGVEANSPEEAAKKADEATDLHHAFREGEYAEEVESILVDTLDANGEVVKETALDGECRLK
jgi:hypothetical protein